MNPNDIPAIITNVHQYIEQHVAVIAAEGTGLPILVIINEENIEIGVMQTPFEDTLPGGKHTYPDELAANEIITFTGRRALLQVDGDPAAFGVAPSAHRITEELTGLKFENFGSGSVIIVDTKGEVH